MLNFDAKKYNEITYQLSQALLLKVTDGLLSVSVESKEKKLTLRVYLDFDKASGIEDKLMEDFETDAREHLLSYEIEFLIIKIGLNEFSTTLGSTSYLKEDSFRCNIFLRFNKLWW
ncbi:hypothetical protein BH10ACI1_BH10ACI1_08580 [soil metagenome]